MLPIFFSKMPIIDTKTAKVFGYEVLLRRVGELNLSDFNNQPKLFIQYHEQLINALKDLEEKNKIRVQGQQLFLNLLPEQLISAQAEMAVDALHKNHDFPLIIEITEASLVHSNKLRGKLQQLTEKGCQLAVDDFGSENSNFLRVLALAPRFVKLDKSFIQAINNENLWLHQLQQLVDFFHKLGAKVIVEGVESEQQFKLVKLINADYVQGFYFGYPEPI